jgi:diacylglycerol O-acyltransferase
MPPNSAFFLMGETRDQPLHVGGLQLFAPPEGADAYELRGMLDAAIAEGTVIDLFQKRPVRSLATMGQWAWQQDTEFDIEHHVRRNALPQPGRVLELLALCSRLHSTPLDRHRPLWETHIIEGLADGRLALYSKAHHALLDGVAALRLFAKTLSWRADDREMPAPWAPPKRQLPAKDEDASAADQLRAVADAVVDVVGIAPSMLKRAARGLTGGGLPIPAPRSILNVPITGARRFAAQDWPIDRIKALAEASGTTVNDVVLAMCSGALRSYLRTLGALPAESLVAMVPVSLHASNDPVSERSQRSKDGGNAVGVVLCNLGTALADPAARLVAVHRSMMDGKRSLVGLSQVQILAMSGLALSPLVLEHLLRAQGRFRPPFNVLISNIPGPARPMFWNGARLDGVYPLGLPFNGQALNITCVSYASAMHFGIVGCRRTVPHLQRILGFLDDEITALEEAVA